MDLTDKIVRELPLPERGEKIYSDDSQRALKLIVSSGGTKSWAIMYTHLGRQRRMTNPAGLVSVTGARTWAKKQFEDSRDPVGLKNEQDEAVRRENNRITVAQLWERYEKEVLPTQSEGTRYEKRRLAQRFILGTDFAKKKIEDVKRGDIKRLLVPLIDRPGESNNLKSLVSHMFNHALDDDEELITANPCVGIKPHPDKKIERYLNEDEIKRFVTVLAKYREINQRANLFMVLLFTGCRVGEAMTMRWRDLDLQRGIWTKPPGKTKKVHIIPLYPQAVALLASMREKAKSDATWVFPGAKPGEHIARPWDFWTQVRDEAQLENVRVHDLRHTFASIAANTNKVSLHTVSALLGHSSISMTQRYAHLFDATMKSGVEEIGTAIVKAME
jgi:integrase